MERQLEFGFMQDFYMKEMSRENVKELISILFGETPIGLNEKQREILTKVIMLSRWINDEDIR